MARTKKTVEEEKNVEVTIPEMEIDWNGKKIHVKKYIPAENAFYIVKLVSDSAFSDDGEYRPEVQEVVWMSTVISAFSDYSIPEDFSALSSICYGTNLYNVVVNGVESLNEDVTYTQIESMHNAVEKRVHNNLRHLEIAFEKNMSEMTLSLSQIVGKMNDTFGNITKDDVSGLIKALSSGTIDEKKIVDAIIHREE